MVKIDKSSRLYSIVAWSVIGGVSLGGLSGCKQVSTWTNLAPAVSTPSADPFNNPPGSNTFYHRPEVAPSLSPVPEFPAPGYSEPIDPPPPPAPEAVNSTGASGGLTSRLRNLRLTSFFNRKDSKADAVHSAAAVNNVPRSTTPNRSAFDAGRAASIPLSNVDPEPVSRSTESRTVGGHANSVSSVPPANSQPPAYIPDQPYLGPIITPGSQYSAGRTAPVEPWPYTRRITADRPAHQFRKQPPAIAADNFGLKPSAQPSTIQPPEQSTPSSAAMPLLLPPGP